MKIIDKILDEHFFPNRKEEIKLTLKKFDIQNILEESYSRIESLHSAEQALDTKNNTIQTIFTLTLDRINQKIIKINDLKEKENAKKDISELSIRLWLQLIREFEYEFKNLEPHFNDIAEFACQIGGYDITDFKRLFDIKDVIKTSEELSGTSVVESHIENKNNSLTWQVGETALSELINQLKKKKWVKKPNNIFNLFNNPEDKLVIIWNKTKYNEMSLLIYTMHEKEIIGVNGNRGFFSAIEKHTVDFDNNKIKKGRLKTLKKRIVSNCKKYQSCIDNVNEIIEAVQKSARH